MESDRRKPVAVINLDQLRLSGVVIIDSILLCWLVKHSTSVLESQERYASLKSSAHRLNSKLANSEV